MSSFIKTFMFLAVIEPVFLYPYPELVRVRRLEDANEAEFVALDTIGLLEKWGYPAEQHNITTEDGYIINLFRIPWSPKSINRTENRPIIFIQTGFILTSDIWLLFGPNRSLAMQLADEGYDVWLGNHRGNTYGREHVILSTDKEEFWNFSYHEVGIYDIPSMVDYVIDVTGQSSMIYLGYSMGTTTLFILLSEHPEYNEKFDLMIMLSPVAGFTGRTIKNYLRRFFLHIWQGIAGKYRTVEILRQSSNVAGFFKQTCIDKDSKDICTFLFNQVFGEDEHQLDYNSLANTFCYIPAGSSTKTMWHYRQMGDTEGKFLQYDYGKEANLRRYGKPEPPAYNLTNVRTPLINFYGKTDSFTTTAGVLDIKNRISSKTISEVIHSKNFNHINFWNAKNVKKLLNDRVIHRISQFRKGKISYFRD